ncbi:hypothetical protein COBT_001256 [Conglomerata obtusa]
MYKKKSKKHDDFQQSFMYPLVSSSTYTSSEEILYTKEPPNIAYSKVGMGEPNHGHSYSKEGTYHNPLKNTMHIVSRSRSLSRSDFNVKNKIQNIIKPGIKSKSISLGLINLPKLDDFNIKRISIVRNPKDSTMTQREHFNRSNKSRSTLLMISSNINNSTKDEDLNFKQAPKIDITNECLFLQNTDSNGFKKCDNLLINELSDEMDISPKEKRLIIDQSPIINDANGSTLLQSNNSIGHKKSRSIPLKIPSTTNVLTKDEELDNTQAPRIETTIISMLLQHNTLNEYEKIDDKLLDKVSCEADMSFKDIELNIKQSPIINDAKDSTLLQSNNSNGHKKSGSKPLKIPLLINDLTKDEELNDKQAPKINNTNNSMLLQKTDFNGSKKCNKLLIHELSCKTDVLPKDIELNIGQSPIINDKIDSALFQSNNFTSSNETKCIPSKIPSLINDLSKDEELNDKQAPKINNTNNSMLLQINEFNEYGKIGVLLLDKVSCEADLSPKDKELNIIQSPIINELKDSTMLQSNNSNGHKKSGNIPSIIPPIINSSTKDEDLNTKQSPKLNSNKNTLVLHATDINGSKKCDNIIINDLSVEMDMSPKNKELNIEQLPIIYDVKDSTLLQSNNFDSHKKSGSVPYKIPSMVYDLPKNRALDSKQTPRISFNEENLLLQNTDIKETKKCDSILINDLSVDMVMSPKDEELNIKQSPVINDAKKNILLKDEDIKSIVESNKFLSNNLSLVINMTKDEKSDDKQARKVGITDNMLVQSPCDENITEILDILINVDLPTMVSCQVDEKQDFDAKIQSINELVLSNDKNVCVFPTNQAINNLPKNSDVDKPCLNNNQVDILDFSIFDQIKQSKKELINEVKIDAMVSDAYIPQTENFTANLQEEVARTKRISEISPLQNTISDNQIFKSEAYQQKLLACNTKVKYNGDNYNDVLTLKNNETIIDTSDIVDNHTICPRLYEHDKIIHDSDMLDRMEQGLLQATGIPKFICKNFIPADSVKLIIKGSKICSDEYIASDDELFVDIDLKNENELNKFEIRTNEHINKNSIQSSPDIDESDIFEDAVDLVIPSKQIKNPIIDFEINELTNKAAQQQSSDSSYYSIVGNEGSSETSIDETSEIFIDNIPTVDRTIQDHGICEKNKTAKSKDSNIQSEKTIETAIIYSNCSHNENVPIGIDNVMKITIENTDEDNYTSFVNNQGLKCENHKTKPNFVLDETEISLNTKLQLNTCKMNENNESFEIDIEPNENVNRNFILEEQGADIPIKTESNANLDNSINDNIHKNLKQNPKNKKNRKSKSKKKCALETSIIEKVTNNEINKPYTCICIGDKENFKLNPSSTATLYKYYDIGKVDKKYINIDITQGYATEVNIETCINDVDIIKAEFIELLAHKTCLMYRQFSLTLQHVVDNINNFKIINNKFLQCIGRKQYLYVHRNIINRYYEDFVVDQYYSCGYSGANFDIYISLHVQEYLTKEMELLYKKSKTYKYESLIENNVRNQTMNNSANNNKKFKKHGSLNFD